MYEIPDSRHPGHAHAGTSGKQRQVLAALADHVDATIHKRESLSNDVARQHLLQPLPSQAFHDFLQRSKSNPAMRQIVRCHNREICFLRFCR